MAMPTTIFDFIVEQETVYTRPVDLTDAWSWSMPKHIKRSFHYLNSQFLENNDDRDLRPFRNIVLPIMNIQFRTEGFDVKDIELYVDNPDEYFKSLLINKYHDKWALEQQIDTFIDEMTESYCTYGGVLIRKTKKARPEVIEWRSIAFANQHDFINHPFAIKHDLSFSELRTAEKDLSWGGEGADIEIEDLITLVRAEDDTKQGVDNVEVYEVHGSLPIEWLNDEDIIEETEMDVQQIQIVAFYKDRDNKNTGVTLFKKRMPKLPFKFLMRDEIQNRALGRGGVEELFDDQQWTNWDEVKGAEMRSAASKTLFVSDDPTFKSRNNLNNVENNEIFSLQEGKSLTQLDTFPRNLAVFNESVDRFFEHAKLVGNASDPQLGQTPSAGTPFKLFEAQQIEGLGMHKYRQGKLAVFMDEIYRDWVLPHLAKEIVKEQNFMAELSADETQMVMDKVLTKKSNDFKKRLILSGQIVNEELVADFQNQARADIIKKGNKRFFKILKDEMKDISLSVMTNIAGKQKNLALMTDKLVNVLRQYIATPQIRQDPEMTKLVNTILESSGLSPIAFAPAPVEQQPQQGGSTQPLKELAQGGVDERASKQTR